eukprot:TRINITY_DN5005_c0_g1_i2.p1 TRINITY_DN5005_c0_g1~~TRINITY_DN5005_c0_g1_i2.p1  ORF type:complete len:474 (-),score=77.26 TRINITY_DN5005_c0_g1_i2:180-1601(-)
MQAVSIDPIGDDYGEPVEGSLSVYDSEDYEYADEEDTSHEEKKSVKKREYKCTHCDATFTSPHGYSSHQKKHKSLTKVRKTYPKRSNRESDEESSENDVYDEEKSVHLAQRGKVWVCLTCGLKFQSQQGYASHQKKHKPKINNPHKVWQCQHCFILFTSSQGYASHQKKHKNRKELEGDMRDHKQPYTVTESTTESFCGDQQENVVGGVDLPEEVPSQIVNREQEEQSIRIAEVLSVEQVRAKLEAQEQIQAQLQQQLQAQLQLQVRMQAQVQAQIIQTQTVQAQLAHVQAQADTYKQLLLSCINNPRLSTPGVLVHLASVLASVGDSGSFPPGPNFPKVQNLSASDLDTQMQEQYGNFQVRQQRWKQKIKSSDGLTVKHPQNLAHQSSLPYSSPSNDNFSQSSCHLSLFSPPSLPISTQDHEREQIQPQTQLLSQGCFTHSKLGFQLSHFAQGNDSHNFSPTTLDCSPRMDP